MFPNFEPLHWFAAQHILDSLRGTVCIFACLQYYFFCLEVLFDSLCKWSYSSQCSIDLYRLDVYFIVAN